MYKIIVLSTQRENIYINVTGRNDSDFVDLWLKASKKRYLKLEGFYNIEDIEEVRKIVNDALYSRYFESIEDFLKW